MSGVVLWLGPVSTATIRPAVPAAWRIVTHNIGDGSAAFGAWASGLGADPLGALGVRDEPVVMAGFSRAHGAKDVILGACAARRDLRLRAVFGFDAYYCATTNKAPKPGYLAFLRWLIDHPAERRALFTTSSYDGPGYASASASIAPLAYALGLSPVGLPAVPDMPHPRTGMRLAGPERAFANGPVTWLDFGRLYRHVDHALTLAPRYVRAFFDAPTAPRASPPAASPVTTSASSFPLPLLALLGAVLRE